MQKLISSKLYYIKYFLIGNANGFTKALLYNLLFVIQTFTVT